MKPAQVSGDRDVGLVAVLLEKQPLEHPRALQPIGRQERRVVGEIAKNGVGFGQEDAGLDFEHRHLAVGILRQEFRRACLPVHAVDLGPLVGKPQRLEGHAHLVAVPRRRHPVNPEHCALLDERAAGRAPAHGPNCTTIGGRFRPPSNRAKRTQACPCPPPILPPSSKFASCANPSSTWMPCVASVSTFVAARPPLCWEVMARAKRRRFRCCSVFSRRPRARFAFSARTCCDIRTAFCRASILPRPMSTCPSASPSAKTFASMRGSTA